MKTRFFSAMKWDMRFQARYGFYFLYGFLTILYVVILLSLPLSWRENMTTILIFSDPAAMGLFFMGAIVLLEKSQRVTSYFAISPLSPLEYVSSKVISLGAISLLVGLVIRESVIFGSALGDDASKGKGIGMLLIGTLLSSMIFTLLGIIIATKISSLNQFILATVPVEILAFVPAILHLFGGLNEILGHRRVTEIVTESVTGIAAESVSESATGIVEGLYPANVCIDLVAGKGCSLAGLIVTLVSIVLLFHLACKCVVAMWRKEGGVRL